MAIARGLVAFRVPALEYLDRLAFPGRNLGRVQFVLARPAPQPSRRP
jgi:hypothetical protein